MSRATQNRKPVKSLSVRSTIGSNQTVALTPTNRVKTLNNQSFNTLPILNKQTQANFKSSRLPYAANQSTSCYFKSSEQLHEQNSTLKLKILTLNSTLGKQRIKQQVGNKNYQRINEKLNVEFSSEVYFQKTPQKSYLVEGVKHQYYNLKQKYEEKCSQYNELLKNADASQNFELRIYCETLENDNKKLKDKVAKILKIQQDLFGELQAQQYMEIATDGGVEATKEWKREQEENMAQLLGVSSKLAVLQQSAQEANNNMEKLKKKVEIQRQTLHQRKAKIQFLEGLIKNKSNEMHLFELKSSKEQKIQNDIIQNLKKSMKEQEQRQINTFSTFSDKQKQRFETQKQIFSRYLKEKQLQVQSLKREIKSLKLMISTLNVEPRSNEPFKRMAKMASMLTEKNKKQQPNSMVSYQSAEDKFKLTFAKQSQQQYENTIKQTPIFVENQYDNQAEKLPTNVEFSKRSYMKHSKDCVKVRPIKPSQIQNFKKKLQYRLIFHKLVIDQALEYLNPTLASEAITHLQMPQSPCLIQFISLKEIKEKLMKQPFSLSQEQSLLLARYIVEDCSKNVVYYHLDNEVERVVAKSIMRAFVGEYSLPAEQRCKEQIQQVLSKNGKNLLSALYSYSPGGYISSPKLMEICQNIRITFSDSTWDYIISQLFAASQGNLSELDYRLIFTNI